VITIPFWMFGVGVSPNSHKHFASQTTLLVVIGEPEQILRCQVHCDRASMCLKVFLCAVSCFLPSTESMRWANRVQCQFVNTYRV